MENYNEKEELKPCPFCDGEVIEHQDDCGGSWIEHKEPPKRGSMQKCILTGKQINTSSRTHADWNTRTNHDLVPLDKSNKNHKSELWRILYDISWNVTNKNVLYYAEEIAYRCENSIYSKFGQPKCTCGEREVLSEDKLEDILYEISHNAYGDAKSNYELANYEDRRSLSELLHQRLRGIK